MTTAFISAAQEVSIEHQQEKLVILEDISTQIDEAKILQSFDNFGDQNQIEILLRQEDHPLVNDSINEEKGPPLQQGNSSTTINVDEIDSFEQLNIDSILTEELRGQHDAEIQKNVIPELIIPTKGVGIEGQNEATINQLDNSDLMDFDQKSDIWTIDIIDSELSESDIEESDILSEIDPLNDFN